MIDLLLPASDAGVVVQLAAIAGVAVVSLYIARRLPEVRIFIFGVWLSTYGAIGLRALH